jgi:hypothetical protein
MKAWSLGATIGLALFTGWARWYLRGTGSAV